MQSPASAELHQEGRVGTAKHSVAVDPIDGVRDKVAAVPSSPSLGAGPV